MSDPLQSSMDPCMFVASLKCGSHRETLVGLDGASGVQFHSAKRAQDMWKYRLLGNPRQVGVSCIRPGVFGLLDVRNHNHQVSVVGPRHPAACCHLGTALFTAASSMTAGILGEILLGNGTARWRSHCNITSCNSCRDGMNM